MNITEKDVASLIKGKLSKYFGVSTKEATKEQAYKAVVMCIRDILLEKRAAFNKKYRDKGGKRVYYLCMEFLLGQSLKNNSYNLSVEEIFNKVLQKELGFTMTDLYELEPDAGLGNGGLGRLAACFMDALASQNYPAMNTAYLSKKQQTVGKWNCLIFGYLAVKFG